MSSAALVERREPALHSELVGVEKTYSVRGEHHTVFKDLNLKFERGANVGVLGPNGAGKSTLLRMIAGAEQPDRGYVDRFSRISWPLGFGGCFQPFMTGTANARFAARIYKADPEYVVAATREFAGIGDFMGWPVKGYSTGMRARFAFALSMAIDFDCILIDEILGVGDQDFRAKCATALDERRAKSDIILVTHNLKDVIRLCDRVVILGGPKPIISDDVEYTVKRYNLVLTGGAKTIDG